ncbi:MAG: hypothetical protein PUB19_07280 [Lachnospiraceae bacterium]|nr:hypothetical protein [Lachnospiraceae bacterium]
MKCENCGAEYGAREIRCPYCGTQNHTGIQWKQEEEQAEERVEKEKAFAIKRAPIYVVNRVANTILLVSLILLVLSFVVMAICFKVEEVSDKHKQKSAVYDEAEQLYKSEDFVALDDYLEEHDLYFADDDRYDVMCEAAKLYERKLDFQEYWMRYDESKEDLENLTEASIYSPVSRMLEACSDILREDSYRWYEVDFAENQKYLEEIRQMATVFLVSEFDYTAEDIERLTQMRSYDEEFEDIVRDAYRRKGWTYREYSE